MPSFDVISKINYPEFDNALANCLREITNRYDFKGLNISIERKDKTITTRAPDEIKLKQVNELLSLLGSLCLLNEENEFNGASIASCINGSFYFWYDEMVKWFIKQGYSEDLSRSFVFENIIGTIEYAKLHKDKTLSDIGASIATDGTYTQAGYKELTESGGLTSWSSALDKIKDRFDN